MRDYSFSGGRSLTVLVINQEVPAEKGRDPVEPAVHGEVLQGEGINVLDRSESRRVFC